MAKMKVFANQLIDGTSWNGYTDRNHLFTAFQDDPVFYMNTVSKIFDVNLGMDFVRMVESHATEYIDQSADGMYQWELDYLTKTNYECVGAWKDAEGTAAVASSDKMGKNGTSFYLDFVGKVFSDTEVIGGRNPNTDRLYVHSCFSVGGDVWRFRVQPAHGTSAEFYYEGSIVMQGTRWNAEAALTPKYLSDRGVDINFRSPARLFAEMSDFRLQHTIAGHMLDGYRPKYFYMRDDATGKIIDKPLWISNVEYEFLKKIREIRANLIMYGRTNRQNDGSYGLTDTNNGYAIQAGSGFYEQSLSSNIYTYVGLPDIQEMTSIILAAVVGKISMGNRKVIVKAGEYGLVALSEAVMRMFGADAYKSRAWLGDNSGRAYKWSGNDIKANTGQVMGVAMYNGIELTFVVDPSKDDAARNKVMMGNGLPGYASSYQYDIIGLGGMNEESNMKIVRRKGQTPIFGTIEGMRGFVSRQTSFGNPKSLSTSIDGSTIHYMENGIGAKVTDPTKVIRYYPAVLPE